MKTKNFLLLCAVILACSCKAPEEKKTEETAMTPVQEMDTTAMLERGEYLVDLGGCHHCHSPKMMTDNGPVPDPGKLLSGHPADEPLPPYDPKQVNGYVLFTMGLTSATGPWGTSFAANLTPDETGIGAWTEEQFFTVMRKGLFKGLEGGRPILPPMPWQDFGKMSDEDLRSVFVYLKSLKPVNNQVPAALPPAMP